MLREGFIPTKMSPFDRQLQGLSGVYTETGTTAVTGDFCLIQILEAATFSVLTETTAITGSDAMTGFSIPANTILVGKFSAFTLTSGKVRAHVSAQYT